MATCSCQLATDACGEPAWEVDADVALTFGSGYSDESISPIGESLALWLRSPQGVWQCRPLTPARRPFGFRLTPPQES